MLSSYRLIENEMSSLIGSKKVAHSLTDSPYWLIENEISSLIGSKKVAHSLTETTIPRSPMHLQCIGLNNITPSNSWVDSHTGLYLNSWVDSHTGLYLLWAVRCLEVEIEQYHNDNVNTQ